MPSGLPSAFPRHRSFVTVSGAYVCTYGYKLSLTATPSLSPTPTASLRRRHASVPLSTRSSPLALCYAKEPPLAFPSRQRRATSFPPSFTQCIFGCTRHSQASLPLLSLERKFARMPPIKPRCSFSASYKSGKPITRP